MTERHDDGGPAFPQRADHGYASTANALQARMEEFMRANPEAVNEADAWGMLRLGFKCGDLDPSLAQAQAAFVRARAAERRRREAGGEVEK